MLDVVMVTQNSNEGSSLTLHSLLWCWAVTNRRPRGTVPLTVQMAKNLQGLYRACIMAEFSCSLEKMFRTSLVLLYRIYVRLNLRIRLTSLFLVPFKTATLSCEFHFYRLVINILYRILWSESDIPTALIFYATQPSAFKIASQIGHKICVSKFGHATL